jgi:hypothetical protein
MVNPQNWLALSYTEWCGANQISGWTEMSEVKKNKKKFENNLVYQNIIITFEYC